MDAAMDEERIVLVSTDGHPTGAAPKIAAHDRDTPLHLGFSCYLIDSPGNLLITRRAHRKLTFPSVWTNSCCGHPAPGERLSAAVRRRVRTELGADIEGLTLVLPRFRYRAVAADGTVENELCPVVRARVTGEVRPNPLEVDAAVWRDWDACRDLTGHPSASPWFREQMAHLVPLGAPAGWPAADAALLPPALSW